jgi:hemerythrin
MQKHKLAPLEWTDALSVGVPEIDRQHKELIRRVNAFICAVIEGQGKDKLGNLLSFMGNYAETHFKEEEKWMSKYNYPGYVEHLAKHMEFLDVFKKLKAEVARDGATVSVVATVQRYLCDWLVFHVSRVDREMGSYLKTKM